MSTSKGSKPAAAAKKAAAGPAKSEANKEKKKVAKLPGAVNSAKYATRKRKAQYVNKQAEHRAKVAKPEKSASFKRMIRRRQVQKGQKYAYQLRVKKAQKEGKPAPPVLPVTRAAKAIIRRKATHARKLAAKTSRRELRHVKADAFIKSYGPNFLAAKKAYLAGAKPKPIALPPKAAKPAPKHVAKPHPTMSAAKKAAIIAKGLTRDERRHLSKKGNPWRPAVPRWGFALKRKFGLAHAAGLLPNKKVSKKPLSFAAIVDHMRKGQPLPKTMLQRKAEAKAKSQAHEAKQKASAEANKSKESKVRKVHPAEEQRLAKKAKNFERSKQRKVNKEKKLAELKKKYESQGKTFVPRKIRRTRAQTFKKHRKINVFDLDRPDKTHKKWWSRSRAKLRKSLKPGTVVIILKGKFAGRRAVFLKHLPISRDLLVNGPFKINGVPLYRISQSFVIATSTRVNVKGVPGVRGGNKGLLTDRLFYVRRNGLAHVPKNVKTAKRGTKRPAHTKGDFFSRDTTKKIHRAIHKTKAQKIVDEALVKVVKKIPLMKEYLQTSFSLSDKDAPHSMKF